MSDNSHLNQGEAPSASMLIKATLGAMLVSFVILVVAVLPAEYGVDPTGLGEVIGLDQLNEAEDAAAAGGAAGVLLSSDPVLKADTAPRTGTMRVPLQPGTGREIKSYMKPGDNFVFSWRAEGGAVSFDMHGERPDSKGAFTSYWAGENQHQASGSFTAPFEGTHGWYWENTGNTPVTIVLETSGFYGDLFMPW